MSGTVALKIANNLQYEVISASKRFLNESDSEQAKLDYSLFPMFNLISGQKFRH
jgi:hypothetical protein